MNYPQPPTALRRTSLTQSLIRLAAACAVLGSAGTVGTAAAAPQAAAPPAPAPAASAPAATASPTPAAATAAGPAAPATATADKDFDFTAALGELRGALTEVTTRRQAAEQSGDKIKSACLYERQRGLAQTVESTQAAQSAYQTATARRDGAGTAAARAEQARGLKALELGRTLRGDAEGCVGKDLARGPAAPRPTTVTVNSAGAGASDDPKAGPTEMWTVKPVRLELPSRPNPASAYRAPR